jgi:hypothetical protein
MTVSGDFADRGVHTMKGSVRTVFETPCLAQMGCRWCEARGVTVTALSVDDGLLGWCSLPHARLSGLRMPGIAKAPSPPLKRRSRPA